ncbi:MAG: hypothetical protein Q8L55_10310 [Phycisphaerales bacterium]|nr:hypothetical protein [Phycisphaerales bacterium]
MSKLFSLLAASAACVFPCMSGLADIAIGSSSNFNNFDADQWSNGVVTTDPVIMLGGPAGPSDPYLRVTSDGSGAGGKLTVFNNSSEWTGLWLTAGITRIEMDFRNFDPQNRTLYMRLGFLTSAGQGQPGWCTDAFLVPADGQWHRAVFTITPATMTRVGNAYDWETAMQWVTQLRILHSITPSPVGTNFTSSVGIDNIIALPVPGTLAAFSPGCLLLLRKRRE